MFFMKSLEIKNRNEGPGAPVVSLRPVEDHVEEVEAGGQPDDHQDDQ